MERWVGKIALVTGASAGIGASIAEELVKKGMTVIGLARRPEKVEEIQAKLKGAKGKLIALKGDVGIVEENEKTFKWIKEKFGTIHVLIANAGIFRTGTIAESKDIKLFQEVLNTNLVGAISTAHQALKLMNESGVTDGHIIFINSIAGLYVPNIPQVNVYSASKFGVRALVETLRQEMRQLKRNIKITNVSPGVVTTEIIEAAAIGSGLTSTPEQMKTIGQMPALEAVDIADAVIYALSTPPRCLIQEITIRPMGELF